MVVRLEVYVDASLQSLRFDKEIALHSAGCQVELEKDCTSVLAAGATYSFH